jgi:hypothetical protein
MERFHIDKRSWFMNPSLMGIPLSWALRRGDEAWKYAVSGFLRSLADPSAHLGPDVAPGASPRYEGDVTARQFKVFLVGT